MLTLFVWIPTMREMDVRKDTREDTISLPPFVVNPSKVEWRAVLLGMSTPEPAVKDSPECIPSDADTVSDQILMMQELERQRIAMDLHDGLGPLITLIKLQLNSVKSLIGKQWGDRDLALAAVQRAEETVSRTFDELRRAVLDLRPAMLDDLGIVIALGWLIRQFELSGSDAAIKSKITTDDAAVPNSLKIVIFRICQETLNNIIKHAQANHVVVELGIVGSTLQLLIEDDGVGMQVAAKDIFNKSAGGLIGVSRRAKSSNGKLTIASADGCGTRITICWQLEPRAVGPKIDRSGNDNHTLTETSH